jgi:hypothetical protein
MNTCHTKRNKLQDANEAKKLAPGLTSNPLEGTQVAQTLSQKKHAEPLPKKAKMRVANVPDAPHKRELTKILTETSEKSDNAGRDLQEQNKGAYMNNLPTEDMRQPQSLTADSHGNRTRLVPGKEIAYHSQGATDPVQQEVHKSAARDRVTLSMYQEPAPAPAEDTETEPGTGLTSTVMEIEILDGLKGKYSGDDFFSKLLEKLENYCNFEQQNGLIVLRMDGKQLLCIPDIEIEGRNVREIIITHAHSMLAHLGAKKTLYYLRDNVWWLSIVRDVKDFCVSCITCAKSKSRTQHPSSLLKPLSVPVRPWQLVGIDFVGPLPESWNRHGDFDMICTIIDHLTSMVHLVPIRQEYKTKEVAELVFDVIYKAHRLPKIIVSDCDSLFTSTFWSRLHSLIGTELCISSSWHWQTDGATERANRTLSQMLRQAIGPTQKNWVNKLPGIEFAINCARSEMTGFSPFFLNYGRMPRPLLWDDPKEAEYSEVYYGGPRHNNYSTR